MIWLLRNWRLAGFGLLVLAFGLYVGYLKLQITAISADLKAARGEIGALSVRVAEKNALLETQNGYIQAWQASALKNAELREAAQVRANRLAASAAEVAIPVPPREQNPECLDSHRQAWLRSQLNELLWPAR